MYATCSTELLTQAVHKQWAALTLKKSRQFLDVEDLRAVMDGSIAESVNCLLVFHPVQFFSL
jgi:hypothetical protein